MSFWNFFAIIRRYEWQSSYFQFHFNFINLLIYIRNQFIKDCPWVEIKCMFLCMDQYPGGSVMTLGRSVSHADENSNKGFLIHIPLDENYLQNSLAGIACDHQNFQFRH